MNLIIDIGNTSVKIAVFNNGKLNSRYLCNYKDLKKQILKIPFSKGIICSVGKEEEVKNLIKEFPKFLLLDTQLKLPIINCYQSPKSLGYDRLANSVGAYCITPNQNNLIIDSGTCLKFDFINNKNQYLGGSISPGLNMRFKALNTFTANLPLMKEAKTNDLIGQNTECSILSGVVNGMESEIINMVKRYRKMNQQLNIYLTGGDSIVYNSIVGNQKSSIFAHDYITLLGLNAILEENTI